MPHGLGHINTSQHFHLTFSSLCVEWGAYIHPTPHRSHSGSRGLSDLGRSHIYASLSSVIDCKLISHYSVQPLNSPSPSFLSPLVCNVLSYFYIQMVLWTTSLPFLQPDSSVRIGFLSLLSQTRTQSLSQTSHKPQAQKVMLSVSLTLKRCFQAISLSSYIRTNKWKQRNKHPAPWNLSAFNYVIIILILAADSWPPALSFLSLKGRNSFSGSLSPSPPLVLSSFMITVWST